MNKNNILFILAAVFTLVSLTTCENTIINKWWVDEENNQEFEGEYDYIALTKKIPIYEAIIEEKIVYEYIYEYIELPPEIKYIYIDRPLPPEILLQHINVVEIEFILFSGNQKEYNEPGKDGGTSLKEEEKNLNNKIVKEMADSLIENDLQLIILHGHANPIDNTPEEAIELEELSSFRAAEVGRELEKNPTPIPNLDKRMTVRGYGGGKNISGSSASSYAGLNRRVEMILIEIETVSGSGSPSIHGR